MPYTEGAGKKGHAFFFITDSSAHLTPSCPRTKNVEASTTEFSRVADNEEQEFFFRDKKERESRLQDYIYRLTSDGIYFLEL